MGAGASIEAQQALGVASVEEIGAALVGLPPETKEKLNAALTPPASEFRKGQDVECRNSGEEWSPGKVFAVEPKVLVKRKQDWLPYVFDEVRALGAPSAKTAVDERLDTKTTSRAKPTSAKFVVTNLGKLDDFYTVDKRKIGEGSYGSVSKGHPKDSERIVAVKAIPKAQMKNLDRFKNEIEIMASMDHPNIAKLYETFEDHRNIYLVMELMVGGELFDRILEQTCFSEKHGAVLMKQAFKAEFYMNEQGICHRDLKPENFLFLDKSSVETSPMKLIDFGLAIRCEKDQVLTTKAGTPYYVAPQVLAGKYDMGAGMWSLGVIMYVIMCGYPPFYGETDADVLAKVRLGNYSFNAADWKKTSEDCKNLIRMCLKMNPRDRCTPEQALNHEWFKNMDSSEPVAADPTFLDNFRQFRSATKFQKVARQAIAMRAKDADIKKLRELFLAFDIDGNGTLTLDEMNQAIEKAGVDIPADLKDIMGAIGGEGFNRVNYTEFLAAALDKKVYSDTEQLWSTFRLCDKNGDGKIDLEELKKFLSDAGGDDVSEEASTAAKSVILAADKNGDSVIDFDEFVEAMKS